MAAKKSGVTRKQAIASIRARIAKGDPDHRLYREVREELVQTLIRACKEEGEWPVEQDVLELTAEDLMAEDGIFRHGDPRGVD